MRLGSSLLHIKQLSNRYANRPVIFEDDKSDTPEPVLEAAAVSVSVRLIPPLEQKGLA